MSAVTRWVEYYIDSVGEASTVDDSVDEGIGFRGYSQADGATNKDTFSIGAGNNRLYVDIDGDTTDSFIILASGTELDPRFVARDITEKLHGLEKTGEHATAYDFATCTWHNNRLRLYSGTLGANSSVAVVSGTQTAHLELGWGVPNAVGGSNNNLGRQSMGTTVNGYNSGASGLTVSGTYNGFFDEEYKVVISNNWATQAAVKGGTNSYTGTMTVGGCWNYVPNDITYTLYIDADPPAGKTMGGGTGEVPILTWTSTGNVDNSPGDVELLYPNYWYKIGVYGLMVKFSDAVFNTCTGANYAWTITCERHQYAVGTSTNASPGTAQYVSGSNRGDDTTTPITAEYDSWTPLGSRGMFIKFSQNMPFTAGDEWNVVCKGPAPKSYDITNLNYGNVTVSTEAPVKAVIFEIMSGAIEMSTVKFGLQSHGSFTHHNDGVGDTYFRFGTVGPGVPGGSSPTDGLEWRQNVIPADIDSDIKPSFLSATKGNLSVVSDADDSENIGASSYMGMVADPIFLNIKLGASEVGANSTINYRIFFDYS